MRTSRYNLIYFDSTDPPIGQRSPRRWRVTSLTPRALTPSSRSELGCCGSTVLWMLVRSLRYYCWSIYLNYLCIYFICLFIAVPEQEHGGIRSDRFEVISAQWHCGFSSATGLPDCAFFICYWSDVLLWSIMPWCLWAVYIVCVVWALCCLKTFKLTSTLHSRLPDWALLLILTMSVSYL